MCAHADSKCRGTNAAPAAFADLAASRNAREIIVF
jgi:hypothetical protein